MSMTWVRDNQAPDAPNLVAPDDGSSHPVGEPAKFTVNATDVHGADGPTSGLATFSVIPAGGSSGPSIGPIVPL